MRTARARSLFAPITAAGAAAALAWAASATTPQLRASVAQTPSKLGQAKMILVQAPQTITARDGAGAAEVIFENIGVTGAETGADDLETTLRFDGPLDGAQAERLATALPRWIAYATPGYDSLLIRTRKKAAFGVTRTASGFALRISWAADPGAATQDNLTRLRYLTMTGETGRARALLDDLRRLPGDADPLDRAEAELLVAERDPRAALALASRLSAANPSDLGLRRTTMNLRRELSDFAEAELLRQTVDGGDTQTRLALRGRADIGPSSGLRTELETVDLSAGAALRTDGTISPFDGARARLRASYEADAGGGFVWSAIVYAGAPGIGAGGEIAWRRPKYDAALRASYHEPTFGTVEAIVNDGTRDFAEASLTLRGARHWSAGATLGYNRYNLDGVEGAAESLGLDAFARYETPVTEQATLIFAYLLDAEYVGDVAVRTDAFSVAFTPLPLADREVHSLGLGVYAEWDRGLSVDAMAGYSYDRYAEGGIFARAGLNYDATDAWRIFANASYAEVNARGTGGGAVTTGSAGVTYRFGGPGVLLRNASFGAGP